ncbi:MAG: sigma 54-interacting transcriptional regulator [Candidatus Saganbacteria bacterium]|nr:sigma 54-interacting transcriptional regulator [Candidatus Saganbacteria bacterium]
MKSFEKFMRFGEIIANSKPMLDVLETVKTIAPSDATVLIYGETGTGKELIAKAIHKFSKRADKPFAAIHCAAIPETLLESELFGHEKGSFTGAYERKIGKFEAANGGTIFLDEVGSIPAGVQAKILRALQERKIERIGSTETIPVDIRIVSASNIDLREAIKKGTFREDLFYRLNVVPVTLPPLRERRDEIPLLLEYFLAKNNEKSGKNIKGFGDDSMAYLLSYAWPGNVRELENLVERMVALAKGDMIGLPDLPEEILSNREAKRGIFRDYKDKKGAEIEEKELSMKRSEEELIREALKTAGGNKSKAAKLLGIHRNTLLNKMKELGI